MNLRQEATVQTYDFWLDAYGVGGRTRRDLRRELRANLADATRERGWREARAGIGPVRELAKAHAEADAAARPGRLRWGAAVAAALATGAVVWVWVMLQAIAFLDGARAQAGNADVHASGPLTLAPGARASVERSDNAFAAGIQGSPLVFLIPMAVVFLIALRPWRLAHRRAR